jgi:hypothetical protein
MWNYLRSAASTLTDWGFCSSSRVYADGRFVGIADHTGLGCEAVLHVDVDENLAISGIRDTVQVIIALMANVDIFGILQSRLSHLSRGDEC